jgi:hypothetical protein
VLLFAPGGLAVRTIVACSIALTLACGTVAHSETDVFMQAVGFALTGSDDAVVKAIDRANCVFAYQDNVFHLNNVQVDRIQMQGWEMKGAYTKGGQPYQWINVGLHGEDVVVEHLPTDELEKLLDPKWRQAHFVESHKEYELRLTTG